MAKALDSKSDTQMMSKQASKQASAFVEQMVVSHGKTVVISADTET